MKTSLRSKRVVPLLFLAALLIGAGVWLGDFRFMQENTTYGNMDVPSERSFVQSLLPGTLDYAHRKVYEFGGDIHWPTIRALLLVFIVMLSLRALGARDVRRGSKRFVYQWVSFVIARLGMFRVSGAAPVARCQFGVFPFFNCQACEMATGACPVGMVQVSLAHRRVPWLVLGTITAFGVAFGRAICGWFCPFGFLLDIVDRVSFGKMRRLNPRGGYVKLYMMGAVVVLPVLLGLGGILSFQIFCATVCPNGIVYGLIPYWATTAKSGFAAAVANRSEVALGATIVAAHFAVLLVYLVISIALSGRFFCRYLCPLGAFLGLFNRLSILQIDLDRGKCDDCGLCRKRCPMGCNPTDNSFLNQFNCIRCGQCVQACPSDAKRWTFLGDGRA